MTNNYKKEEEKDLGITEAECEEAGRRAQNKRDNKVWITSLVVLVILGSFLITGIVFHTFEKIFFICTFLCAIISIIVNIYSEVLSDNVYRLLIEINFYGDPSRKEALRINTLIILFNKIHLWALMASLISLLTMVICHMGGY